MYRQKRKIKQVIIQYDDGSFKGYNYNAFKVVTKIHADELMKNVKNK